MQTLTPIFSLNFAYNAKSNVMNRMKFFMFFCVPWKSSCCSSSRSQALFHSQAFPIRKRPRLLFSELLDVATGATDWDCEERRIVFGYFHPWNFSGKLIMGVQLLSLAVCTIATSFFAPVIYRLILINRPTKDSRDGTRIV